MKADDLWSSILQYAIQGKLIPQDPNDEPASVLLDKICEKKQRLVREGKIKKNKKESRIYREDGAWFEYDGVNKSVIEIPFDIPDSWCWIRGYMLFKTNESIIPTGDYFYYIDLDAIDNVNCKIREMKKIPTKGATSRARRKIKPGDVLFSTVRPYLRNIAIVYDEHKGAIASTGFYVCNTLGLMDSRYLYYLLQSSYISDGLSGFVRSERSPSITNDDFLNYYYPLPPFEEQQRIVSKIEEIRHHINSYRKYEARRVELNADLASSLKKSILQYAIQGKLVPQDLNDEPASVLLERICEDKQGLVKEGKIKKSKKETRIYNRGGKWYEYDGKTELELEVPFEIPGSWIWVRLKTICDKITDGTHHSPPNGPNGEYMYISAKNIKDSGIDLSNVTYVSETVHREIYSRCDPKIGDILFIKDGATTGTVTINTLEDQFSLLSSVALIRTSSLINPNYVISIMKSPLFYREVRNQMDGGAITRVTFTEDRIVLIALAAY